MEFFAVDVETANADMASICSIAIAKFLDGNLVEEWHSLINPDDFFDAMNISIHGIDEVSVSNSPKYFEVAPVIAHYLQGCVVVTHTQFDRVAIRQASARWKLDQPDCRWIDSARVARRAWPECARSGYGLANVCKLIGHSFQHHDALEDAKAAGKVLVAAMEKTSLGLDGWLARVNEPISAKSGRSTLARESKTDGPLQGEVVVFTGALTISRQEAADLAASVGGSVATGVTRKTTLLVVGDTDVARLAGHEKSSKHRKAEQLIAEGAALRIIRETDFLELLSL